MNAVRPYSRNTDVRTQRTLEDVALALPRTLTSGGIAGKGMAARSRRPVMDRFRDLRRRPSCLARERVVKPLSRSLPRFARLAPAHHANWGQVRTPASGIRACPQYRNGSRYWQLLNLSDWIAVAQLNDPFAGMYWVVNTIVQPSIGSMLIVA